MITRSLGDFELKHGEFNQQKFPREYGYRTPIKQYSGDYVSPIPEISQYQLTKNSKYLIMGSDGLWDEMKKEDVLNSVK